MNDLAHRLVGFMLFELAACGFLTIALLLISWAATYPPLWIMTGEIVFGLLLMMAAVTMFALSISALLSLLIEKLNSGQS